MLRFVVRKMLNKKWMILALLVGSVLLIGIAAANPMYTETVLQRTLETDLGMFIRDNNAYPMEYRVENTSRMTNLETIDQITDRMKRTGEDFGLPIRNSVVSIELSSSNTVSNLDRTDRSVNLKLTAMSDFEDHIKIIVGTGISEAPDQDGVIDAVVSKKAMVERQMLLGEILTFEHFTDKNGDPLRVRIAGVYDVKDETDTYWSQPSVKYDSTLYIDMDYLRRTFFKEGAKTSVLVRWYTNYDYSNMTVTDIPAIMNSLKRLDSEINKKMRGEAVFEPILEKFQKSEKRVRTTFLVLQIPVYALLAVFIFMVSSQLLGMEQGEIAVLKSRGANRRQIIGIYLLQNAVTELIALAIGIPLAFLLVRLLASSNAFLEFVRRKSMFVKMNARALCFAIVSAMTAVAAMTAPVLSYAGTQVTVVSQKQKKKHRQSDVPFWEKYFLDVIILAISLYGLYSFNNQKAILAERVLSGEPLDPLLFLSSSLFMFGAGLLTLRIFPWITRFIFSLFKKRWSPAVYTSFTRILRTKKQQGLIMVFLVMTIAIGVFFAVSARTFNNNDEKNVRYINGADVVLAEKWQDNSLAARMDGSEVVYNEPDFARFDTIEGLTDVTKVLAADDGSMTVNGGRISDIRIRGIETKKFGETAWFDSELLPDHWYNYLNVLASRQNAVILSSNLKKFGLSIGDMVVLRSEANDTQLRCVIYGFVDYWPGYAPVVYEKSDEGVVKEKTKYLAVMNLQFIQSVWGVTPYQVWMKFDKDTSGIYDFIETDERPISYFEDTQAELIRHRNDGVLQGTNGIMTLGFMVSIVICAVGFLIYWILSVRSRALQFGIFRAMGMSMREIFTMLFNEQLFISGGAILGGAITGAAASILFIPLIQIAYSSADSSIPLKLIAERSDMLKLAAVILPMIVICLIILGLIVKRLRIAQALKLGED